MSQSRPRPTITRSLLVAVALIATGLLSACSDRPAEPPAASRVASVPRSTLVVPLETTTPAGEVEGPLIRYDTSQEEEDRLHRVYLLCLKREGLPIQLDEHGGPINKFAADPKKDKKELAACASKRPETVPDREERKDPAAYQDHLREWVKCMQNKGQKVVLIPPDGWGTSDEVTASGYTPDFRIVNQCQHKVFGS
jgi:hypothetical protein